MFKKLTNSRVISDEGYEISFNQSALSYREERKVLRFDVEHLVDPWSLVVYAEPGIGWCRPYQSEPIGEARLQRILLNIRKALDFLQVPYEIDEG